MINKFNIKIITRLVLVATLMIYLNCKNDKQSYSEEIEVAENFTEDELKYRPLFHFTPKNNWMNDPNGMFYLNGKYHLYFQHYPDGNVWGPMHWGHAISEDLINFEEQPIALYPDEIGLIFSGSAVVDYNNTSGFSKDGKVPVVAIYTYHNMEGEKRGDIDFQTQGIAYSLDEGMTWTKYSENPVIKNPGIKDFRDPKVFWDNHNSKWIMSLAAGNKIMIYSSANLKEWKFESEFGEDNGDHGGVWECPDLFPVKVKDSEEYKWALLVSINPSGPNGGSATQYFIGDFDGHEFTIDDRFSKQLDENKAVWLDYGRDNYAGVTWSNISDTDGRKLFIGWMSNWDYARDVPTYKWRSTMTVPRELNLIKKNNEYILKSIPVKELNDFKSKTIEKDSIEPEELSKVIETAEIDFNKLNLEFNFKNLKENKYQIIFNNGNGDSLIIGLNNNSKTIYLDRTKSGKVDFSEKFAPNISKVKLSDMINDAKFQILLDKTSVELFVNDGEIVMTELFFPNNPLDQISIISEDSYFIIKNIVISELNF
ncbi:glycoside hydrolase family 32 protein [Winogradskyella sp. KYW1333]|uniref:glycoside hydrolase family 32 protein n=1 Tax=Winogradskyella sp. KYW1333 TaxID=2282123 RepID=UPI000DF187E4|nr:glycoside hydrolase family 32 protein [Winogradskyella sp. KYW1333]RCT53978.1 glycoside hydrolase family 32 protein [Winogradskyella sp. KYW1333]